MAEFLFQINSDIVLLAYAGKDNYLIQQDPEGDPELCALYFSSNDIYYPNNELQFIKRIIKRDFYEWYSSRVPGCGKHIFIRDIYKQWYIGGINSKLNSPEKLLEWLKVQTEGCRIVTVGSSAGGYAAMLFGAQLKAERILVFNGFFDLYVPAENPSKNPLLAQAVGTELKKFLNIQELVKDHPHLYYFYSDSSPVDKIQYDKIKNNSTIKKVCFHSSHHGIPFLKCCLPHILKYSVEELDQLAYKRHFPLLFSLKIAGIFSCIYGGINQLWKLYKKKY